MSQKSIPAVVIRKAKKQLISLKKEKLIDVKSHPLHEYWLIQLKFWESISNNNPIGARDSMRDFLKYAVQNRSRIKNEIDEIQTEIDENENETENENNENAINYAKECFSLILDYSSSNIKEMLAVIDEL